MQAPSTFISFPVTIIITFVKIALRVPHLFGLRICPFNPLHGGKQSAADL